jgi:hypothetical protein
LDLIIFAGLAGMIPAMVWWLILIASPLSFLSAPPQWRYAHPALYAALNGGLFLGSLSVLGVPSLAACLVLRARQPRGARVEWDEEAVVEWDGPWQRTRVPWERAVIAYQRWVIRIRGTTLDRPEAVQLVDRDTRAVISVWENTPPGAPLIRRRIYVGWRDIQTFIKAIEGRKLEFERARRREIEHSGGDCRVGNPDWSVVADPDRPNTRWRVILGRFGYVGAVLAPLCVGTATTVGAYAMMVAGALLLVLRAQPVFHELRAIGASLVRVPPSEPHREVLRMRLRAVRIEAFLRGTFVVLVILSTIISHIEYAQR